MDSIEQVIQQKLKDIEEKEKVNILYCAEAGSRAWGFASPDSDYDVRFIYARSREDYLRLEEQRDVIEWQLDEVLDINGWDIRKTLKLLYKSNPTLFEWKNSPIVYRTFDGRFDADALFAEYFSPVCGLHHYLHMAESNYRTYVCGERVRLKKYFYALRPVLAARWIMHRKSPPPVPFAELVSAELDNDIKPVVDRLLELKAVSSELGEGERIDVLNEYLEEQLFQIKSFCENSESEPQKSYESLNKAFLNLL